MYIASILIPFIYFQWQFSMARNFPPMLIRSDSSSILARQFLREHFCHFDIENNSCWIFGTYHSDSSHWELCLRKSKHLEQKIRGSRQGYSFLCKIHTCTWEGIIYLFIYLNFYWIFLGGWHWLIKLDRFQVYNSMIHHRYIVWIILKRTLPRFEFTPVE